VPRFEERSWNPSRVGWKSVVRRTRELLDCGEFEAASRSSAGVPVDAPLTPSEWFLLGKVALVTNRLDRAEVALSAALEGGTRGPAVPLLAETFYRLDEFEPAARWFRHSSRESMARKLESFAGDKPYDLKPNRTVSVRMLQVDPLPVVRARVNDRAEGNFLLDTGGAELYLDSEFAERVGAIRFGPEEGVFAGGKRAAYQHGRIDGFRLGGLNVGNVPVHIVSLGHLRGIAGRKRIHGIIGTVFLYHFRSTLDYLSGRLVLEPRDRRGAHSNTGRARRVVPVAFGLDGDHFMVARGAVNRSSTLLFIDSGLAGGGFTCPAYTMERAGIPIPEGRVVEGQGGGGSVKARRFVVESIELGRARQDKIIGWYGIFPPFLEHEFGYRIGGLLSHGFLRNYRFTLDFDAMRLYLRA
jgi:Aspartyl protease